MRQKRGKRNNQRGIALITTVFLLAISVVAIGATIVLTHTEISTVVSSQRSQKAFSLAEAGVDWAAAKLRADAAFSITSTTLLFDSGQTTISFERMGNNIIVVSQSQINGSDVQTPTAQRAIRTAFTTAAGFNASTLWHRAITTDGKLTGSGNINIRFDDPAKGPTGQSNLAQANSIVFSGNIDVVGSPGLGYVAGGSVQLNGNIGDTTKGLVPTDTITTPNIAYWRGLAQASGHLYSGNQSFPGNYTFDGLYVNGNLSLSGNATLNGVVFAEGAITVAGNFRGNAVFVTPGSINMSGNVDISGMQGTAMIAGTTLGLSGNKQIQGYLYAGGAATWTGNANLVGAITAKGAITFSGNVDIRFHDFTDEQEHLPPGFLTSNVSLLLLSWEEIAVTVAP
ncbi:MAG: hypothetical protein NTV33_01715 [Coprothermobacterota bacterium]|nr:hypothetical protein [Coprothermobacterota bacterium]